MNRGFRAFAGAIAVVATVGSLTSCASGSTGDTTTIEFFQYKSEAVDVVDDLIDEFEAEHPDIEVVQTVPSDSLTELKAALAKGDVPDVVNINASNYYELVEAGVLSDLGGTQAQESVTNQSAVDYLSTIGLTDTAYALPLTVNAQAVLYDKDQFAELGLEVPTSWDEFVALAQTIEDAGETPFEFTWKDSWVDRLLVNGLGGPEQGDDFAEQLRAGDVSFSDSDVYREVAERALELKQYAQEDPFGTTYDDGNAAFANGDSVLYIQGTWAIPEITSVNPDKNVGVFVLPTGDSADENSVVSGPDSIVGIPADSENTEAAQEFVDFLFSQSAQEEYADDQHLISVRSDVSPSDDELAALKTDWIDEGRTAIYLGDLFDGSSDLAAIAQTFLDDEDVDAFLEAIDEDYEAHGVR